MNYWESHTQVAVRFRRFDRKRYAAFGVCTKSLTLSRNSKYATIRPARHGAKPKR